MTTDQVLHLVLALMLMVVGLTMMSPLYLKYIGSSEHARLERARLRFGCRAYVTPFEVGGGRMEYTYSLGVYDRLMGHHISYEKYMPEDWKKLDGNSKWMALQFAKKDYYEFLRGWVQAEFAEKDAAKAKHEEDKKFVVTKHRVR